VKKLSILFGTAGALFGIMGTLLLLLVQAFNAGLSNIAFSIGFPDWTLFALTYSKQPLFNVLILLHLAISVLVVVIMSRFRRLFPVTCMVSTVVFVILGSPFSLVIVPALVLGAVFSYLADLRTIE